MKEEDSDKRLEKGFFQDLRARFKNSNFIMNLDWPEHPFDLNKTPEGEPIYFPLLKAKFDDVTQVSTSRVRTTGNYGVLSFLLDPVEKQDMLGEFYVDEGQRAKSYRYHLLLNSEKGIFISEAPAVFDDDEQLPYVVFRYWRPVELNKTGKLYVPIDYKSIASIDVMLEEKV